MGREVAAARSEMREWVVGRGRSREGVGSPRMKARARKACAPRKRRVRQDWASGGCVEWRRAWGRTTRHEYAVDAGWWGAIGCVLYGWLYGCNSVSGSAVCFAPAQRTCNMYTQLMRHASWGCKDGWNVGSRLGPLGAGVLSFSSHHTHYTQTSRILKPGSAQRSAPGRKRIQRF